MKIPITLDNIKATVEGQKTVTRRQEAWLKAINKEPDKWEYHSEMSIPQKGRFAFRYDNRERYNHQTAIVVIKVRVSSLIVANLNLSVRT